MTGSRVTHVAAVVAVFSLLLVAGAVPVSAVCRAVQGDLLVPTGNHNPPPVVSDRMQDARLVHFIRDVEPGARYTLRFTGAMLTACVGSTCADIADFNVAWYGESNALLRDDDTRGDQSGFLPDGVTVGVIYMPFGPDAGQSDGSLFARFHYSQGCP